MSVRPRSHMPRAPAGLPGRDTNRDPRRPAELEAHDPPAITGPERYWLVVETADEVLDYREAVAYYAGAFQSVVRGGDHSLTSFPEFVPDIVAWAREDAPAPAKAKA